MLRADALTVVHHDDTTSEFTDVSYALDRHGLRVVTADGDEKIFAGNDVLTTHVRLAHQTGGPVDVAGGRSTAADPHSGDRRTGDRRRGERRAHQRSGSDRRAGGRRAGDSGVEQEPGGQAEAIRR